MVHYADSIIQIGSLIDYSTIRFEAKHSCIKSAAHTVHNNINLILSVVRRHQIQACYNIISNNLLNEEIEIIDFDEYRYANLKIDQINSFLSLIDEKIEICENNLSEMFENVSFRFYGQLIKKDMCLIMRHENVEKIARISNIFLIQARVFLYCNLINCLRYNSHYCAYEIDITNEY